MKSIFGLVASAVLAGIGACIYGSNEFFGGSIMFISCINVLPLIESALPDGQSLFNTRRN